MKTRDLLRSASVLDQNSAKAYNPLNEALKYSSGVVMTVRSPLCVATLLFQTFDF